ncbi:MAG: DNA gyrase subunit A [Euryarchaeota archaeon]|nr:DNA gyrase subunit A [Euryarchaeota archaeon]MDE1836782.1 DNA gyrase subunit A [Euryarchaeota archaeon]MDE1879800.1 DNA gyrase subunit A [Euryarchaeota archaeon]MDE2044766.1 DNA gyrase subunit A [Thermoplasmata archaeon]
MAEAPASPPPPPPAEAHPEGSRVRLQPLEREMHRSYIDYAMSVIVGRALPNVRDGLKPVQVRILWSMWESGATHDKPFRKSARTVGDVLGKYHPHGDMSVYDALVRMAQPFSLRYPLIEGQGNFGSIDGDTPAAMRYTEARLGALAEEMLQDIEKETVEWTDNFDGSLKEPRMLPSKLPNLLVNGASGIAVGMATNMPPHNLGEVVDALRALLADPNLPLEEIMKFVPAPDFPTGGIVSTEGLKEAYTTGRGIIQIRARAESRVRDDRNEIVVTEIPYEVNKSQLLQETAELVKSKRIDGITDLRDESDKDGISVVFELRRDAQSEIVLNQLFTHTKLQVSFGIINLALVDGRPRVLPLKELLQLHLDHRREIVRRRSTYDLRKAQERLHILEGFLTAIDHIDEIVKLLRRSKDVPTAQASLMGKFLLSEEQAKAILDMRLARLTALERESILEESEEKKNLVKELEEILARPHVLDKVVDHELEEIRQKYGDARRTQLTSAFTEHSLEDLIPDTDIVVLISNDGYIKRLPLDSYRRQRRGGKGLVQMETKEEDFVTRALAARTHDDVLFFTSKGRVYRLKAYELPELGRHAKGKAIVNLLPRLQQGEKIQTELAVRGLEGPGTLVFATAKGLVKRTELTLYQNIRVSGIQAILLEEGDELVDVALTQGDSEILLATKEGQVIRFKETELRPMGRATYGVIGARLGEKDQVVGMSPVSPTFPSLLTLTSTGFGKRTPVEEYRLTKRGASGVIGIKTGGRNGEVVAVIPVREEDEILVTTQKGITIRSPVRQIREQGRNTLGVIIIRIEEGDEVKAAVRLVAPGEASAPEQVATTLAEGSAPPPPSPPPPALESEGEGSPPNPPSEKDEEP